MRHVNLDELEKAAHTVSVTPGGPKYRVRPVTARITGIVKAAQAATDPDEAMRLYYDAVALLVPMMPRGEVDDLSATQLLAIVELAGTEVTAIEEAAADPNAVRPAPVASASGRTAKTATTRSRATSSAASS